MNASLEIWKDIENYEGYYQVSNLGRIRSLDRKVIMRTKYGSHLHTINGTVIAPCINKYGYSFVRLTKEKKSTAYTVHRLVAKAFLPNPNHLPCVNHKDEVKTNNLADNLEWCTYAYNNSYGTHLEKISKANKGLKRSEETCKRMSESRKGSHLSEETKRKLSEINKGEGNPNYGLKRSEETKEKMRKARVGFRQTEEAKQKLREAALAQWERKRAEQAV